MCSSLFGVVLALAAHGGAMYADQRQRNQDRCGGLGDHPQVVERNRRRLAGGSIRTSARRLEGQADLLNTAEAADGDGLVQHAAEQLRGPQLCAAKAERGSSGCLGGRHRPA